MISKSKRDLVELLGLAEAAEGVRIFIGSENKLFSMSGSSLIVAPFHDNQRKVVGVLGVIGPTRIIMRASSRWWTTQPSWSAASSLDFALKR